MNVDDLYTAEEAAVEVGVDPATLYVWVKRGFLEHAGKRGRYKLFKLDAVFEAEAGRKHQHRRKVA